MLKILLVCTGNTCRSPMAAGLLYQQLQNINAGLGKGHVEIWTAGLYTQDGWPASPQAVEAMREEGIDLSGHLSSSLSEKMIRDADLILTMTTSQRNHLWDRFPAKAGQIYTLSEFAGDPEGEIRDPYGQNIEVYRICLLELKLLVDRLLAKIIESIRGENNWK